MSQLRSASPRRLLPVFLLAVGLAGLTACTPPDTSTPSEAPPTVDVRSEWAELAGMSATERRAFLEEKAAEEGKVVMYSSSQPTLNDQWMADFNAEFPDVALEVVRLTTADTIQRTVAESDAGRPAVDVLNLPGDGILQMIQAGMLGAYVSPEAADFDASFTDPDALWTTTFYQPFVNGYNTDLIDENDVPVTLEDLAAPGLQGQWGMPSVGGGRFVAGVYESIGEADGKDLLDRMAAQAPQMFESSTALANALSSGQVAVGAQILRGNVADATAAGAPVDFVVPDPLFILPIYVAVTKDAPHPYAAALFYDWLLSKAGGQQAVADLDRAGPRTDMDYPNGELLDQADKVVTFSPTFLAESGSADYDPVFADLFVRN
jgi:iron(III) transport system substrate-binding protein